MAAFINESKALLAWLARVEIADLKEPLSVSIIPRYLSNSNAYIV